jgi:hypothetical protein
MRAPTIAARNATSGRKNRATPRIRNPQSRPVAIVHSPTATKSIANGVSIKPTDAGIRAMGVRSAVAYAAQRRPNTSNVKRPKAIAAPILAQALSHATDSLIGRPTAKIADSVSIHPVDELTLSGSPTLK